jgi:hypothetical protein
MFSSAREVALELIKAGEIPCSDLKVSAACGLVALPVIDGRLEPKSSKPLGCSWAKDVSRAISSL